MTDFPDTSTTLLVKLSSAGENIDQAAWQRFFELYHPVMVNFIVKRCNDMGRIDIVSDADDIAQKVMLKTIEVFKDGKYNRSKGKFRAYLTAMLKNSLLNWMRSVDLRRRGDDGDIDLASLHAPSSHALTRECDEEWNNARHRAAIDHVLTKTAISEQSRMIYREILETGDNCATVARRLGIAPTTVRKVKSRISKMIRAYEKIIT